MRWKQASKIMCGSDKTELPRHGYAATGAQHRTSLRSVVCHPGHETVHQSSTEEVVDGSHSDTTTTAHEQPNTTTELDTQAQLAGAGCWHECWLGPSARISPHHPGPQRMEHCTVAELVVENEEKGAGGSSNHQTARRLTTTISVP